MTSLANCTSFMTRGFLRVDRSQASTEGGAGTALAADTGREFMETSREKAVVVGVEDRAAMRARSLADVSGKLRVLKNKR